MYGYSDATHLSFQLCGSKIVAQFFCKNAPIYCCCVRLLCSVAKQLTRNKSSLFVSAVILFSLPVFLILKQPPMNVNTKLGG